MPRLLSGEKKGKPRSFLGYAFVTFSVKDICMCLYQQFSVHMYSGLFC